MARYVGIPRHVRGYSFDGAIKLCTKLDEKLRGQDSHERNNECLIGIHKWNKGTAERVRLCKSLGENLSGLTSCVTHRCVLSYEV